MNIQECVEEADSLIVRCSSVHVWEEAAFSAVNSECDERSDAETELRQGSARNAMDGGITALYSRKAVHRNPSEQTDSDAQTRCVSARSSRLSSMAKADFLRFTSRSSTAKHKAHERGSAERNRSSSRGSERNRSSSRGSERAEHAAASAPKFVFDRESGTERCVMDMGKLQEMPEMKLAGVAVRPPVYAFKGTDRSTSRVTPDRSKQTTEKLSTECNVSEVTAEPPTSHLRVAEQEMPRLRAVSINLDSITASDEPQHGAAANADFGRGSFGGLVKPGAHVTFDESAVTSQEKISSEEEIEPLAGKPDEEEEEEELGTGRKSLSYERGQSPTKTALAAPTSASARDEAIRPKAGDIARKLIQHLALKELELNREVKRNTAANRASFTADARIHYWMMEMESDEPQREELELEPAAMKFEGEADLFMKLTEQESIYDVVRRSERLDCGRMQRSRAVSFEPKAESLTSPESEPYGLQELARSQPVGASMFQGGREARQGSAGKECREMDNKLRTLTSSDHRFLTDFGVNP